MRKTREEAGLGSNLRRNFAQRGFQFKEIRLHIAGHPAAADFHRNLRRIALQMRHQDIPDNAVKLKVFILYRFEADPKRAKKTVGQKHP